MKPSTQKNSGLRTILWWVLWISATIVTFFIAAWFWTPLVSRYFGSIHSTRASIAWVTAVFGTWLIALVPLIVVMYSKVDKAYEDARIRKEKEKNRFRSVLMDSKERQISSQMAAKLKTVPETIPGGHLVKVRLKNGEQYPYVFISERTEILGIYGCSQLPFKASEIEDIEADPLENPPNFVPGNWLRLDGVTAPE